MQHAPMQMKISLLSHAFRPKCSCRWPYQIHAAKRIDRTQTKMIGIIMNLKPCPGDDVESFARRRNRAASGVARSCGRWSEIWRKRVVNCNEHLGRTRNQQSWAHKTLHYRDNAWLQEQRRIHAVGEYSSLTSGRTCTSAGQGIVHKRWHDGVDTALEFEV